MSEISEKMALAARMVAAMPIEDVINGDNPPESREKNMDETPWTSFAARVRRLRRNAKRLRNAANGGFVYYPPNGRIGKEWGFQP